MKKIFFVLVIAVLIISGCGTSKNAVSSETKTEKNTRKSGDGSSFEKAIVVNSISEEYDYIRKNCSNCKVQQQALVFNNKIPYDVLTVMTSSGKQVKYYFDISSFFGKGF